LYDLYVCYYQGKIIPTVDGPVMTPDDEAGVVGDVLVVPRPCEPDDYYHERSYVLESRDELLCACPFTPTRITQKPSAGQQAFRAWFARYMYPCTRYKRRGRPCLEECAG
jgi:hypothetical protein